MQQTVRQDAVAGHRMALKRSMGHLPCDFTQISLVTDVDNNQVCPGKTVARWGGPNRRGDSNRGEWSQCQTMQSCKLEDGTFLTFKSRRPTCFYMEKVGSTSQVPKKTNSFRGAAWQKWKWLFIPVTELCPCTVQSVQGMQSAYALCWWLTCGVCSVHSKDSFRTWNSNCSIYIKHIH